MVWLIRMSFCMEQPNYEGSPDQREVLQRSALCFGV